MLQQFHVVENGRYLCPQRETIKLCYVGKEECCGVPLLTERPERAPIQQPPLDVWWIRCDRDNEKTFKFKLARVYEGVYTFVESRNYAKRSRGEFEVICHKCVKEVVR